MRSLLVFSFCFRDSFQLQSLPIQVFHAATSVAHWNRQNVVQLWRRQSSLHRVCLSHILHYFLNPSRWKIMEWFVRYLRHKMQRRKDDWGRCQVMENVFSDQPHQNTETSWQLLVLRTAPFISCGSPSSLFSPLPPPSLTRYSNLCWVGTLNHKSVSLDGIRKDFILYFLLIFF